MAKKMIRPIRSEGDYDAALEEIEQSFEKRTEAGYGGSGSLIPTDPDHSRLQRRPPLNIDCPANVRFCCD